MRTVKIDIGGESKEFPLGVSILLYGSVASGKTTFCLTLTREFLRSNIPCIWVCLDESPASLREKMEYFHIDYGSYQDSKLLRFIDTYSEQITGKPMEDPYVINCSSAFNLNELNRSLMRALSEVEGQGIVVFDSVSTLLLYNGRGTCEEFLKVHMSRITSAGFTGLFILQRELHELQTEEILKMMCDSVLEFGFEKDVRKISILKLPLGSSGEWIESSLFAWQQQPGITVGRPPGPRKYMDSGGYIEEFKEGLVEGLKEGLSNLKITTSGKIEGAGGSGGGVGESARVSGRVEGVSTGGSGGGVVGSAGRVEGGVFSGRYEGVPTVQHVQHVDKQIIVTELSSLPEKIVDELRELLNEQLHLREVIHEKEEQTKESRKRLDLLLNKETQATYEVREFEGRKETLLKTIAAKKTAISQMDKQRRNEEAKYREAVKRQDALKAKIDKILARKKSLEDKIHNLVEGSGELYIDLAPYLQEVLAKREGEVAKSREILDALDGRNDNLSNEIKIMGDELGDIRRQSEDKIGELEDVKDRKVKVESELGLISAARAETESKLREILAKKRELEQRLRELTGGSA